MSILLQEVVGVTVKLTGNALSATYGMQCIQTLDCNRLTMDAGLWWLQQQLQRHAHSPLRASEVGILATYCVAVSTHH